MLAIKNPFRVGADGSRRVCAEKWRRLRRWMRRNPATAEACGLTYARTSSRRKTG